MNEWQKTRFSKLILDTLFNTVQGKRIALLGFAFKKDTGDVRESAAAGVAASLLQERAKVHVFDPKVSRAAMLEEMEYSAGVTAANTKDLDASLVTEPDAYTACAGAHAVAVLTEWDSFKVLDWRRIHASMMKPSFVFDGRNVLDHAALREIGFSVYSIGAPVREA